MNAVQIRMVLQRIYENKCKTCVLRDNGRHCGRSLPYKINGKGFAEHEVRNGRCDAYKREKIRE